MAPSVAHESPEEMQMLILAVGKFDELWPVVELWKDPKYKGGNFPHEEQEKRTTRRD